MAYVRVVGYCPECGQEKLGVLFNEVRCMSPLCPRPTAAAEILSDPEVAHILDHGPDGFTIRHPMKERLDDRLMECQLHNRMQIFGKADLASGVLPAGRYRCWLEGEAPNLKWAMQPVEVGDDQSDGD